jgi:Predicted membrane protein
MDFAVDLLRLRCFALQLACNDSIPCYKGLSPQNVLFFLLLHNLLLFDVLQLQHYRFSDSLQRILCAPAFMIWSLIEVFRLYCGYFGNFREMVPQVCVRMLC